MQQEMAKLSGAMVQLQLQLARQQQSLTTHSHLGRSILEQARTAVTGRFKRARGDDAEMGSGLPAELNAAFQKKWASAKEEKDLQV
jgi:hypothetical protein